MEDNNNVKIKFKGQEKKINSVFIFKDGDFMIFVDKGNSKNYYSIIYDAKTLKPKHALNIVSLSYFFYLTETEYGIQTEDNKFQIYEFNKERTKSNMIQTINLKKFSSPYKLSKASNGDILLFYFYFGGMGIDVYRKNNNEEFYKLKSDIETLYLDDIININEKEVLGYKKRYSPDYSIEIKVLNNENYKVIRENSIYRVIMLLSMYKVSNDKLISAGNNKLYIFDLNTLELETIIQLSKIIKTILIRPKGNIFLITKNNYDPEDYYIDNIKIDYKTNELILNETIVNINKAFNAHGSLSQIENYPNNGFVHLVDYKEIIIYDKYYD